MQLDRCHHNGNFYSLMPRRWVELPTGECACGCLAAMQVITSGATVDIAKSYALADVSRMLFEMSISGAPLEIAIDPLVRRV